MKPAIHDPFWYGQPMRTTGDKPMKMITWILTSYIVAAAIMTPLTGWLAGAFGIKGVFLISVAGFTLSRRLSVRRPADVDNPADRDRRLVDRADLFCPGLNDAAAPWVRC
jgi:hypothetical protein